MEVVNMWLKINEKINKAVKNMYSNKLILTLTVILTAVVICLILILKVQRYKVVLYDRKADFAKLIGKDYANVEITDIQYEYVKENIEGVDTWICVFLEESEEALQSKEYYHNKLRPDQIPVGHIEKLEEMGIELNRIQNHGENWKDYVSYPFFPLKLGVTYCPYIIHWYQLDSRQDYKGNVLLFTYIPDKIVLDINKIMESEP